MHPIAVAQIACEEVGLGSTSICAALLHDVVEDTDYTTEDIENIFGPKVANIVDGLTKISGGIFGDRASAQAENFKKLLLAMSDDIRVILIKICDRLHNMRTLASQPANKQYKIAGETLYIYAPLANRLGLNKIKTELEDLSFRYEHPDEYASIERKLASTQASRHTLFDEFTAPIREALDKMGIKYVIKERVKSPYSIWCKMQNKHVSFDEIYDILAVRIIFTPKERENEINECFNIYVAISRIYKSHPDRLRDWLNHPKRQRLPGTARNAHVPPGPLDRGADTLRPHGRGGRAGLRRPLEVQGGRRRRDSRRRRRAERLAAHHKGNTRRPAARCHGLPRCHQAQPLRVRRYSCSPPRAR